MAIKIKDWIWIPIFLIILAWCCIQASCQKPCRGALSEAEVALNEYRVELYTRKQLESILQETIKAQREEIAGLQAKVKAQSQTLVSFPDIPTMRAFLASDNVSENQYVQHAYDCDDFSMDLVKHAHEAGYIMYPELTVKYFGNHIMCWTLVADNLAYFIEPQTDEIRYFDMIDPEGY